MGSGIGYASIIVLEDAHHLRIDYGADLTI